MNETFILQNQDKLFFGKSKEWVDGYDANAVFKTPHKDEAVNQMFEITSKDYKQRVKVISCALDEKALPIIDSEIMPAPLPKVPKPPKAGEDLFAEPAESPEAVAEMDEEPEEELSFSAEAADDEDKTQATLI
ncbi:hypothetical protein GCM10011613_29770 [Cellvibrio zantedeschiae]|uniref:Uncharacterized protein n=1 Tax=Cellvibrio zantedeschiae TaxID=1237077 RepID=A0ABQ3B7Q6_9GAMM|nr:hypothetical protein [Cellvibrio zantedeschiae]GGY82971.1 hypothetical protein GCM10011613_29770 [Cellvibrio zantedeschiae]